MEKQQVLDKETLAQFPTLPLRQIVAVILQTFSRLTFPFEMELFCFFHKDVESSFLVNEYGLDHALVN